jgi:hypothetical protein
VRRPERKGRLLFCTHESPLRNPQWAVGAILEHEDRLYRVTRWVELRPIRLDRGGSVGQWEIWGRRISGRRLRKELLDAAEAVLGDGPPNEV